MKLKHQIINVERIQGITSSVYREAMLFLGRVEYTFLNDTIVLGCISMNKIELN